MILIFTECPLCRCNSIWFSEQKLSPVGSFTTDMTPAERLAQWRPIWPEVEPNLRVFPSCPPEVYRDYVEARRALPASSRASAALSRRALQAVLHKKGVKGRDLAQEIQQVLASRDPELALPSYLASTVDAVRVFGNFGAHPIPDRETGAIIDVDPGEAEACLLTVEELIDFYFERPAESARRRDAAKEKLDRAGKGALRGPEQK